MMSETPSDRFGLPAIERPNGAMYRPRKIIAYPIDDDDCDCMTGVVVFGTHDVGRALDVANRLVRAQVAPDFVAVTPRLIWWTDGFRYGRRTFETDPDRGRAGVYFAEIVERTP